MLTTHRNIQSVVNTGFSGDPLMVTGGFELAFKDGCFFF